VRAELEARQLRIGLHRVERPKSCAVSTPFRIAEVVVLMRFSLLGDIRRRHQVGRRSAKTPVKAR
jgi:hypothetical protein